MKFNKLESFIFSLLFIVILAGYFSLKNRDRSHISIPSTEEYKLSHNFILVKLAGYFLNIENNNSISQESKLNGSSPIGNAGKLINKDIEYSPGLDIKLSDINKFYTTKKVVINYWCLSNDSLKDVVAVCNMVEPGNINVDWQGINIMNTPGKWYKGSVVFYLDNKKLDYDNILKIYFWNRSKDEFYLNEISVEIYGEILKDSQVNTTQNVRTIFEPFEISGDSIPQFYTTEQKHSGNYSYKLNSSNQYSPGISKLVSETTDKNISLVTIGTWFYPIEPNFELLLVATIRDPSGKEYVWEGRSTDKNNFKVGEWSKHRAQFKLPEGKISSSDIINVYAWNKGNTQMYIDDFEVVYGEQQVRVGGEPAFDTELSGNSNFQFKDNEAPFRLINLDEQPNYGLGELLEGKFHPGSFIGSGKFIKSTNLTQILTVNNKQISVFGFCQNINGFNLILKANLDFEPLSQNITIGDFDGDGVDDLFLSDAAGNMHIITFDDIKQCRSNSEIQQLHSRYKSSVKLPNNEVQILVIDHDNNGKNELLIKSKDSDLVNLLLLNANAIEERNIRFNLTSDTKINKFLLWDDISDKNSPILYFETFENGSQVVYASKWNSEKSSFQNIATDGFVPFKYLDKEFEFIKLPISNGLFLFNFGRRFDLKYMESVNHKLIIKNNVELGANDPTFKPKFFEHNKLLGGYFTRFDKVELLSISTNCMSNSVNDNKCLKFDFKPVVSFYNIVKK